MGEINLSNYDRKLGTIKLTIEEVTNALETYIKNHSDVVKCGELYITSGGVVTQKVNTKKYGIRYLKLDPLYRTFRLQ